MSAAPKSDGLQFVNNLLLPNSSGWESIAEAGAQSSASGRSARGAGGAAERRGGGEPGGGNGESGGGREKEEEKG